MASNALWTFCPLTTDCQIYHINRLTSRKIVHDLIELARQTTRFMIDTENDYSSHQPALIQIEYFHTTSTVLLIETCQLPDHSSVLFWLIQSLLKIIFQSSNVLLSWGDVIFELSDFLQYGLFTMNTLQEMQTINVQHRFKIWYNKTFVHTCGLEPFDDDNLLCTCTYRPVKNPNNPWSLQRAIQYTFNEFLDKSRRKSNWGRLLSIKDVRQYAMIYDKEIKAAHEQIILYAVNDCLAATKLMMVIDFNWTKEQLAIYKLL